MDFRFKYRRHPASRHEATREERQEQEVERRSQGLAVGMGIPFTLAGGPITGWLAGAGIDKLVHTQGSHLWTIILILLGTVAGLVMTVELLSKLNRQ